jgi:8-oxo-dGTP diphosphatase
MTEPTRYTYDFPRPRVATDMVLFAEIGGRTHVLLIQRANEPFQGDWALPGGFVEENEPLDACARRELQEETGVTGVALHQFYTYGDPGRDPRGWSLSVAYWGDAGAKPPPIQAESDAAHAEWHPLDDLPPLAFDHDQMIARASGLREQT